MYDIHFQRYLGAYSFLPFAFTVAVFGVFTWWQLPETKNKTIDELYKILSIDDTHEDVTDDKVRIARCRLYYVSSVQLFGGSIAI